MAIDLSNGGGTQGGPLSRATSPVSGVPFTWAGWVYRRTGGTSQVFWTLAKDPPGTYGRVEVEYTVAGSPPDVTARWYYYDGSSHGASAYRYATLGNAEWHHIVVVMTSAEIQVYVDGVAGTAGTGSSGLPALTNLYFGSDWGGSPAWYGALAEAGLWNTALSAGEIAYLAAGLKPSAVAVASLVAYWPFTDNTSPSPDDKNDYDLTLAGSAATQTGPPMVDIALAPSAAAALTTGQTSYLVREMHPATVAAVASGQTPSRLTGTVLRPDVGVVALAGVTPYLVRSLFPAPASVVLAGPMNPGLPPTQASPLLAIMPATPTYLSLPDIVLTVI